jgi:hypothetical protein
MSARRATAFLAVSFLVASGCSNYRFVRGPYGTVDVPHLIAVLESRKDEPRLREVVWLPLLYRSETTFERTRRSGSGEHGSGEAGFREDGFTFYEMRGVGPLSLLWARRRVVHHDEDGERYHMASESGFGYRLAASSSHWVRGEDADFEYRRGEVLFGILRSEDQGFVKRRVPLLSGSAPSPPPPPPPDPPPQPPVQSPVRCPVQSP